MHRAFRGSENGWTEAIYPHPGTQIVQTAGLDTLEAADRALDDVAVGMVVKALIDPRG